MIVHPARSPLSAFEYHRSARWARLEIEYRKLRTGLLDCIRCHPGVAIVGHDPVLSHLALASGLGSKDFVAVQVAASGRRFSVLCVPTRLSRDPSTREIILQIKASARESRTKCILVPQACVRGNVRARNAHILAAARHVEVTVEQIDAMIRHISQRRITTLRDCATAVPEHEDPFAAVLWLCLRRIVVVDRSQRITGMSWVSMPD